MDEINNSTHVNENEVSKIKYELNQGRYLFKEYKGKMVEMTLADFQNLQSYEKKCKDLINQYNAQKDELNQCKQELKKTQGKIAEYLEKTKQRELNWKNALDVANRKLNAFTNNQKGGKVKFTPEMQRCVLQIVSKGGSITMAHNAVMREFDSPDISYETIRRYVAEIRLKSR